MSHRTTLQHWWRDRTADAEAIWIDVGFLSKGKTFGDRGQSDYNDSCLGRICHASGAATVYPIAGKNSSYGVTGLSTLASNNTGAAVLVLNAQTGEVTLQRTGRFMVCGSLYVAGAIRKADPKATIDVMGALFV